MTHPTPRSYFTYLVATGSHTLYIGVTSKLDRLVGVERYTHPGTVIAREKQLKGWIRTKKIKPIREDQPHGTRAGHDLP